MCSIVGVVDKRSRSVRDALRLIEETQHRGPDSVGLYLDGTVRYGRRLEDLEGTPSSGKICLGHSRLAIVGGSEGRQPVVSASSGLALIHNGEIYNYRELRQLAVKTGPPAESDSQVLLDLIEEFYTGDLVAAVTRVMPLLDGMYAFAVTNGAEVVLARDPIGKKPVYYVEGYPFYFASETKALRGYRREVLRLDPGHVLSVSPQQISVRESYRLEEPPIRITDLNDAVTRYAAVVQQAVRKRLAGLDRAAVLLSGGVDSTLVARVIQELDVPVVGYCVGLEDGADLVNGSRCAEELGIPLRTTYLTEDTVAGVLPEVIEAIELNGVVQVGAAIPMYLAAKMAAEDGHKVMFTGQGADELFGGYAWYPSVAGTHGHLYLHQRLWEDIRTLYLDTLEREDRMTMAHGLELRAPFLDRDVIWTAMQISPALKVRDGSDRVGKRVHRELARRQGVPGFVAEGKKLTAQHGSAIPDILEALAEHHFQGRDVPHRTTKDYGSNYRYLADGFGSQKIAAYLAEITERHGLHISPVSDEAQEGG